MKKHYLLLTACTFLFLSSTIVLAQKDKNSTIDATLTKDNKDPDFIALKLPFMGINGAPTHFTISADIGAKFKKGPFYIDAGYQIDYGYGFERLDKTLQANSVT